MRHDKFSARRRQVMTMGAIGIIGAGSLAAPALATTAREAEGPLMTASDGKIIVSGRIVSESDGRALAGAQIEIWRADARGVRAEHTREVVITDGDGRYFAALNGTTNRLHYRVSHQGFTAKVAQLYGQGQRSVTWARDQQGVTRAAFEMSLAPRNALAFGAPDYAAL